MPSLSFTEGLSCTVSIGVSTYSGEDKTFEELLNIADKKLYLAKENGRNRVEQQKIYFFLLNRLPNILPTSSRTLP
ncbi:MAG: diguanylate cyclase [Thermotogota bacterium]|nr:diguanylate cyclase [Thermotogota bacterium]